MILRRGGRGVCPARRGVTMPAPKEKMLFKNFKLDLAPLIYAIFAVIGGFLEVFTFLLHNGVFCNAQTGNVVMLVLNLVQGHPADGLRYLYSILAYVLGIVLTAVIPDRFAKSVWPMAVTIIEIAVFIILAVLPEGASDWYVYATVSFLCAVQYNTFTKLHGNSLATTFCTNNLRQIFLHLVRGVRERSGAEYRKSGAYLFIVLCFALGVVVGAFAAEGLGRWSPLVCAACLLPALALFLADKAMGRRGGAQRGEAGGENALPQEREE